MPREAPVIKATLKCLQKIRFTLEGRFMFWGRTLKKPAHSAEFCIALIQKLLFTEGLKPMQLGQQGSLQSLCSLKRSPVVASRRFGQNGVHHFEPL